MGIGNNITDHRTGASLRNLINSTLQRAAGTVPSDGIIVLRILSDLNLACDSAVLPLNLRAFTRILYG